MGGLSFRKYMFSLKINPAQISTLWQSEWVETDWSKSDNKALATEIQFNSLV